MADKENNIIQNKKKIFFICAEKSGNNIIKQIFEEINNNKEKYDNIDLSNCEFQGVVYEDIAQEFNIKQIFSPKEIAVLGIGDILFALPRILDRITDTAKAIIKFQPDLVLSVDAYDFCIRVAKKVRKIQNKTQINDKNTKFKPITFWHIVAPSVWAYFSGRAKTLAKYYNHLFYLLPFERKYFAPFENNSSSGHQFSSTFIGFPAVFQEVDNKITKQDNLIGITIGSRKHEIKRHYKIIIDTILRLKMYNKDMQFVILATKETEKQIQEYFKKIKNVSIISDENKKKQTIQKCKIVIAKSGTNNLEIGALKTPMITYYKISTLTRIFAFFFTRLKFVNLINITLNKMVIPELLQNNANGENLAWYVIQMLEKPYICDLQLKNIEKAIAQMKSNDLKTPFMIFCEKLNINNR